MMLLHTSRQLPRYVTPKLQYTYDTQWDNKYYRYISTYKVKSKHTRSKTFFGSKIINRDQRLRTKTFEAFVRHACRSLIFFVLRFSNKTKETKTLRFSQGNTYIAMKPGKSICIISQNSLSRKRTLKQFDLGYFFGIFCNRL